MKYSDRSIACAYCNKQMRRRNLKRHCLSLHPGKETQESTNLPSILEFICRNGEFLFELIRNIL